MNVYITSQFIKLLVTYEVSGVINFVSIKLLKMKKVKLAFLLLVRYNEYIPLNTAMKTRQNAQGSILKMLIN